MNHLIKDNVMIEWEAVGESLYGGEYDPKDPNDIEVLRFYVSKRNNEYGEWEEVESASYCTRVPVSATPEELEAGLRILMNRFHDPVTAGESVKKLGEEMSWISLDDIRKHND